IACPLSSLPRDGGDVRGGSLDSSLVAAFAALGSLRLIPRTTSKSPATTSAPDQDRENQRRCTFGLPHADRPATRLLWKYRRASNRKLPLPFCSSRSATPFGLGATDTN